MSRADRDKWDAKYRAGSHRSTRVSPFLESLDDVLPRSGRAIDVAGGAGRNALWLAERGLDVTVADVSEVGLAIAAERASAAGLSITTLVVDLEEESFPEGPWDLIVSVCFLQRSLFALYPEVLAPNGLLVFLQPTVVNLERHERPPRSFLLEQGEAASLISGLTIVSLTEGWTEDGHHEARVVARKGRRHPPPHASSSPR